MKGRHAMWQFSTRCSKVLSFNGIIFRLRSSLLFELFWHFFMLLSSAFFEKVDAFISFEDLCHERDFLLLMHLTWAQKMIKNITIMCLDDCWLNFFSSPLDIFKKKIWWGDDDDDSSTSGVLLSFFYPLLYHIVSLFSMSHNVSLCHLMKLDVESIAHIDLMPFQLNFSSSFSLPLFLFLCSFDFVECSWRHEKQEKKQFSLVLCRLSPSKVNIINISTLVEITNISSHFDLQKFF